MEDLLSAIYQASGNSHNKVYITSDQTLKTYEKPLYIYIHNDINDEQNIYLDYILKIIQNTKNEFIKLLINKLNNFICFSYFLPKC